MPDDPRLIGIYTAARRHRTALEKRNAAASERMYQAWLAVMEDLRPRIDAITTRIDEARAAGDTVNPAWLYQQARYRELIDGARDRFNQYANLVYNETTGLQRDAADRAIDAAYELTRGAFGGMVTDPALPHVLIRPDAESLKDLIGFLGDGSPLSRLFSSFGDQAAEGIARALTAGVATGRSPIEIARSIRQAAGIPRSRAETIARTELHRAYRSATQRTFEANSDVISGWIWHAAQQRRTCSACWAMHGTFHPVTERLRGHVRCRCSMLPQTKTWEELGIEGVQDERITVPLGSDLFAGLSDRDQRFILGKSKYDLYKSGKITLSDLVTLHKNPIWGDSYQEASIAQALRAAEERERAARKAGRPPRKPRTPKDTTGPAPTAPAFKPGAQVRAEIEAAYGAEARRIAQLNQDLKAKRAELDIAEKDYRDKGTILSGATKEERENARDRWQKAYNEHAAISKETRDAQNALRRGILEDHIYVAESERAQIKSSGAPRRPSDRASDEQLYRYKSWSVGYDAFTRLVGTGHLDGMTISYHRQNKRSFYRKDGIYIDRWEHGRSGRVIVHEMGHWLEERSPGFHEEIYQHYQARTSGDAPIKLKDLYPTYNYRDDETTKRDKWIDPYSGKDYTVYGLRNSEIVSMTLEQLYTDPYAMLTDDPDTFDLVWRLLRSKNRPPKRRKP